MQAAWAHSEHGHTIACASEDGIIRIWQQVPAAQEQPGAWHQTASLEESILPISTLQFAPKQLGLQLAAASQDGNVRFYQANRPLSPDRWQLSNDLQVHISRIEDFLHCRPAPARPFCARGPFTRSALIINNMRMCPPSPGWVIKQLP